MTGAPVPELLARDPDDLGAAPPRRGGGASKSCGSSARTGAVLVIR